MESNLTAVILTKNSADTIKQTLNSVSWVKEIIVIDNNSADETLKIVDKYTKNVHVTKSDSFAERRNLALKHLNTDWVMYIDSDEVITLELREEIEKTLDGPPATYRVRRNNYFLGKKMYDDIAERLFHKDVLQNWTGKVHESPTIRGKIKRLANPLLHYTHRDISSMLAKTEW